MLIDELKNKKIMIWGFGVEGEAVLEQLILNKVSNIVIYNDNELSEEKKNKYSNIEFYYGKNIDELMKNVDVIIKAPGVSLYKKEIRDAIDSGVKITSSSNIFIAEVKKNNPNSKIIAVTGSKGKSTTSSLICHILKNMNKEVVFGGNIGLPLIKLINKKHDYYICEFSSYQAADLQVSPDITILTNLFPEHIDWHLTHENYYNDKVNIFKHQKDGDISVINAKCEKSNKYVKLAKNIKYFNDENGFYLIDDAIYFQNKKLLSISDIKLEGKHNLENITAVLTVMNELKLDIEKVIDEIKIFNSLPHRLENIGTYYGVEFINDSISTTPETAIAAIKSFNGKNKIIVLGGYDRKQDYSKIADFINQRDDVKTVIAINQTANRIVEELKICKNINILKARDLEEAVSFSFDNSNSGDMVIFSPAAPSYEVYKNFMERGEFFTKFVRNYKK